MSDSYNRDPDKRNAFNDRLYEVDSWLNSSAYTARSWVSRAWDSYSAALSRCRVRGFRRFVVEILSDGASLATIFLVVLYQIGVPEVEETDDVWNQGREVAVTFMDKDGQMVGRRGVRQDDAVPLSEFPPVLIKAVLATEDTRFFEHFGVDYQGIVRALMQNVRANDVVQGGSTITQQLAKNLFLSPERTLKRKINEAFLALWIEARLSKKQILKMYLDRAYLGAGTYGVEAAAQFYFNKSIRDVTLPEAAILAGLFKAPSKFAPHIDIDAAHRRANVVLERMVATGFISESDAYAARRNPAEVVHRDGYESPEYFLDFAYDEVRQLIEQYKLENEYNLEVTTTVDLSLQKIARATINNMIDVNGKASNVTEAALVSMAPDGAVKVIIGGRDYETSQFNRATDARRQPGSSFKPIVYLAALRAGMRPDTVLTDAPIHIGNWSPQNYSRSYRGQVTLEFALKKSINTIPVRIAGIIGRKAIIETAELIGLDSKLAPIRSLPLGTEEVTVMDLTSVYAAFANGGRPVTPYAVLEIRRPNGDVLYSRERNAVEPIQAVNPVFIGDLNFMLNQVVLEGTGRRAYLNRTPVAGKTGTTQDYRDAWFLGFTARHVTGVWLGNDDYSPMHRVTGGGLPAQTWHDFMVNAERGQFPEPLPGVPVSDLYLDAVEEIDDTAALALLQASSRDPVVKVLYNLAGLFRNAQEKTAARATSFDSVAEFRTEEDEVPRFDNRRPRRHEQKNIWTTPNWEGGFR